MDTLQQQMKSYRKQLEEAEELAALNLAKFKQAELYRQEAEERAQFSELALAEAKTRPFRNY